MRLCPRPHMTLHIVFALMRLLCGPMQPSHTCEHAPMQPMRPCRVQGAAAKARSPCPSWTDCHLWLQQLARWHWPGAYTRATQVGICMGVHGGHMGAAWKLNLYENSTACVCNLHPCVSVSGHVCTSTLCASYHSYRCRIWCAWGLRGCFWLGHTGLVPCEPAWGCMGAW